MAIAPRPPRSLSPGTVATIETFKKFGICLPLTFPSLSILLPILPRLMSTFHPPLSHNFPYFACTTLVATTVYYRFKILHEVNLTPSIILPSTTTECFAASSTPSACKVA